MRFMPVRIERVENVHVLIEMAGHTYKGVKGTVSDLGLEHELGVVREHDVVKVSFDFTVEYYGVVRQLRALIQLMDNPDVTAALIGEREDLDILFAELVDAIRGVKERVGK